MLIISKLSPLTKKLCKISSISSLNSETEANLFRRTILIKDIPYIFSKLRDMSKNDGPDILIRNVIIGMDNLIP